MRGFVRTFNNSEFFSRISSVGGLGVKLYGLLLDMADWRLGRVVSTQEELAVMLDKSVRSIERAVKDLSEQGLIRYKRGIYAINPEFSWGGRSWNIPKASYYTMGSRAGEVVSIVQVVREIKRESLEEAGRETLREITRRSRKKG
ncbi:hypothetical protein AI29_09990 [bacteria symbiont BFo2 of Frankliniella occidentalis]|nr:hypothetical protein AI29_09990 [bacteria symbiont BFo2 of Frankliniella occidentalis]KYP91584.1 hypothetical protein WB60_06405 [bacteria symbiont BFo2 of Frankliniella occidentalis]KYP96672.1 hypothetical protein WB67_01075 [bacteria symbiont BFo2 of Frankliniella occidentalis]